MFYLSVKQTIQRFPFAKEINWGTAHQLYFDSPILKKINNRTHQLLTELTLTINLCSLPYRLRGC